MAGRLRGVIIMLSKWIALLGLAAMLAACSTPPTRTTQNEPWNGGIWNSVLGYVGPANQMVVP
jgi:starvation-inducible outer membrane lipoprotein